MKLTLQSKKNSTVNFLLNEKLKLNIDFSIIILLLISNYYSTINFKLSYS